MNLRLPLAITITFFTFFCCEEKNSEPPLAKVGEIQLTKTDLISEIPLNLDPDDSLVFVENYIHNWIVDHLITKKAEELIPNEVREVEKKMKKYKLSLISHEFEQFYVNKRLDTNINSFEIQDYYNNHLDDFVLNDYVVKCLYVKVPKNSKKIKEFKKYYHIYNESMIDDLMSTAQKEANSFYYNPDEWIYYDDLLKQIPQLEKFTKIYFIKKKKKVILESEEEIFFVNIYDYLIKDGTSPMSFEKEKIKSIILNQRANQLRKKLRLDVYEDALKNKKIDKFS